MTEDVPRDRLLLGVLISELSDTLLSPIKGHFVVVDGLCPWFM